MQLVEDNIEELEAEFRRRLIEARKQSGMTQKELHNITGLSQQAISRIEVGKDVSPSLKSLLKYVDAIGCNLKVEPKQITKTV